MYNIIVILRGKGTTILQLPKYVVYRMLTMYYREDEILNYFVSRSTNALAEQLTAKIKDFWAQ